MASVQDSIECPQCEGKAFLEFHTRTFEEEIICPLCGYREHTRPVIDRERQRQDPQHRAWFKCRRDGERIYRTMKNAGFGAYYLAQRSSVGVLGTINCQFTERVIARFKREMAKPEMDSQRCLLTRWDPKRKGVETVIGRIPKEFP